MKVIAKGHAYELENFEKKDHTGQIIQFIQKEPIEPGSTQLTTISDGTTTEEVIEMVIDRLQFLNGNFPCRENSCAITKLEEALMWLNKRTSDRIKRQVEGQNIA